MGGVCTNSKREPDQSGAKRGPQVKEMNWFVLEKFSYSITALVLYLFYLPSLYPGDLIPFVRKPLFLIVDSDNSWVFQSVPQLFGQPLVVLMSPQDVPSQYQGTFISFLPLLKRTQRP